MRTARKYEAELAREWNLEAQRRANQLAEWNARCEAVKQTPKKQGEGLAGAPSDPESRRFARIAEAPHLTQSGKRLMHLCLAMGIDWQVVKGRLVDGDSESAVDQLDHDKGDGRELAAVVGWLRLLAK